MHPVLQVMLPKQEFTPLLGVVMVLLLLAIFASFVLVGRFRAGKLSFGFLGAILKPARASQPVVAYKKAALATDGFYGVGAHRYYSVDAEAEDFSMGFHAYESPDEAQAHVQGGDVVLEVLLSGKIKTHEKGYIASHQRVLQLFPTSCSYCASTHVVAFAERGETCVFLCDAHAYGKVDTRNHPLQSWPFGEEEELAPLLSDERPLAELPEAFFFLQDAKIVVASFTAKTPEDEAPWLPTVPPRETHV
jgi:hypothetical protein